MRSVDVAAHVRPAEILLVVPPFAYQDRPALGAHLLQAIARERGVEAQVLYANILFAARFGESTHSTLTRMQYGLLLGERLFARAAFGGPPLGRDRGAPLVDKLAALRERGASAPEIDFERIAAIESEVPAWLESFCPALAVAGHRVVGCSTSFEQTSASLAIIAAIKRRRPEVVAICGGANCEGEMAEGVASLSGAIDHVFSGESEETFARFVDGLIAGRLPPERIVRGSPRRDLDSLPTPDYADYYEQMRAWAPDSPLHAEMHLTYETSRGCWWGEKNHCTFCGLNGQGMAMRQKSPDRVIEELSALLAAHPTRLVAMTDNIMPRSYFDELLPRIPRELPRPTIMYEQKANLSLAEVELLVRTGVREIQPGIEALSTDLLRLMKKGTSCAQNIALLRFARATGLRLHWNLLVGFPGDELAFYRDTLELVPLLCHLQPPHPPCPVVFDRFSPYFDHPERHGITELRPFWFYRGVFPESVDLAKIAYHFEGDFDSAALESPEIVRAIGAAVGAWRSRFYSPAPAELRVLRSGGGYLLIDSRGLPGVPAEQVIDEQQAAMALVTRPPRGRDPEVVGWALDSRVAVERDNRCVALAIAEPELIHDLAGRTRRPVDNLKVAS